MTTRRWLVALWMIFPLACKKDRREAPVVASAVAEPAAAAPAAAPTAAAAAAAPAPAASAAPAVTATRISGLGLGDIEIDIPSSMRLEMAPGVGEAKISGGNFNIQIYGLGTSAGQSLAKYKTDIVRYGRSPVWARADQRGDDGFVVVMQTTDKGVTTWTGEVTRESLGLACVGDKLADRAAAEAAVAVCETMRPVHVAAGASDPMARCKKVMAAAHDCGKDQRFVAAMRPTFGWPDQFDDAVAHLSQSACKDLLDPENPDLGGFDLSDRNGLDRLAKAAGRGCAALAAEFNNGSADGRVGLPFVGPEAD